MISYCVGSNCNAKGSGGCQIFPGMLGGMEEDMGRRLYAAG